jgi:signal recognition particle GTPase
MMDECDGSESSPENHQKRTREIIVTSFFIVVAIAIMETETRKQAEVYVFVVEGLIGAGKTTLLETN